MFNPSINLVVLPGVLDAIKKKFSYCIVTSTTYKSKAGTPVILYKYYQQFDHQLVASLYIYKDKGSVFKDHTSNQGYTDSYLLR